MRRRNITPTSFAFLDVICCGFGAVILLVMILNGDVLRKREQQSEDLRAELKRVSLLEAVARDRVDGLTKEIQDVELQEGEVQLQAERLEAQIKDTSAKARKAERQARVLQKSISSLKTQSAALKGAIGILRAKNAEKWDGGKKPVGFSGDGQRQYLTGLKLGGNRTLILVDSSASMLDETVVNVIRRKLTDPATRRTAPKWQRALRTLHWLIANLRPGKRFQIYQFNTRASSLITGTDGNWLSADDASKLTAALATARRIAPGGGTSLHRAFDVIGKMSPRPDSVILLTDGLPTQGSAVAAGGLVSARERLELFLQAVRRIPGGVPINTLLFPMEGDPFAAGAFWRLAVSTKGAFITPSRDWP